MPIPPKVLADKYADLQNRLAEIRIEENELHWAHLTGENKDFLHQNLKLLCEALEVARAQLGWCEFYFNQLAANGKSE